MAQQESCSDAAIVPATPGTGPTTAELVELLKQGKVEEFNKVRPRYWSEISFGDKRLFFNEIDLSGQDFSGLDLRAVELGSAILRRVNFSDADLRGAILECSDITGANFSRAKTKDANFRRAEGKTSWLAHQLAGVDVGDKERIDFDY